MPNPNPRPTIGLTQRRRRREQKSERKNGRASRLVLKPGPAMLGIYEDFSQGDKARRSIPINVMEAESRRAALVYQFTRAVLPYLKIPRPRVSGFRVIECSCPPGCSTALRTVCREDMPRRSNSLFSVCLLAFPYLYHKSRGGDYQFSSRSAAAAFAFAEVLDRRTAGGPGPFKPPAVCLRCWMSTGHRQLRSLSH